MGVRLVAYNEAVFEKLNEWNLDDEMRKKTGGFSLPMEKRILEKTYDYEFDGLRGAIWGVELTEKGIIGAFFVSDVQPRHKRCAVHISFDEGYQKALLESTKKFLDYIFNEVNMETIHCVLPEINGPVIAFCEKVGFKRRCIIPSYFNFQGGWIRGLYYSLEKKKRRV